jgi:hypothetical protein
MRGEMNQVAPIEERNDAYTLGQNVVVDLLYFCFDSFENGVCVSAFAQQERAFDHIGIVDDLAVVVVLFTVSIQGVGLIGPGDLTEPDLGPLIDDRDILDAYRRAGRRFYEGVFDLLNILIEALCLNVDLLCAGNDEAASGIGLLFVNCCSTWAMLSP